MSRYYDWYGQPMTREEWAHLYESTIRTVGYDVLKYGTVSTVWLGLDQDEVGPPLIFETLVLGGPLSGEMWRYTTEAQAEEGHARAVALVRALRFKPWRR